MLQDNWVVSVSMRLSDVLYGNHTAVEGRKNPNEYLDDLSHLFAISTVTGLCPPECSKVRQESDVPSPVLSYLPALYPLVIYS